MLKGFIKKADIILLVAILIIGVAASLWLVKTESVGDTVIIKINGDIYGKYSILEDRTIEIKDGDNSNTVIIKGGSVKVSESNCSNKVCVRHGKISASGESIICLPHKLVVLIEGKDGDEYDSITS